MDFTHQLLTHVVIEIEPVKHDEHIHFVLLNFHPQLGKLNANGRKLNIMIAIMEPVWKKYIYYPQPNPPPPLEFPGPFSPNRSEISNLDFLCFKQIHELLGLEWDQRCSKAANIQEWICENLRSEHPFVF